MEELLATLAASLVVALLLASPLHAAAYIAYVIIRHHLWGRATRNGSSETGIATQQRSKAPQSHAPMSPTVKYSATDGVAVVNGRVSVATGSLTPKQSALLTKQREPLHRG